MDFITPAQCRAARALLNWSQPDLAKRCKMHVQTISNFESGKASPTKNTLKKIKLFLEKAGVSFTDQGGVNPNISYTVIYEDREGFRAFMDDVYETVKKHGGDVYLFNSRPLIWYEWLGEEWYDMHRKRMKALGDRIRMRISLQEGDTNKILSFAQYRWFPVKVSKDKIFYAYGPKLAFLDFGENSVRITVITHKDFSQIFRILYDIAWENISIDLPDN